MSENAENTANTTAAEQTSVVEMIMDGNSHSSLVTDDELKSVNTAENSNQEDEKAPETEEQKNSAEDSAKTEQPDKTDADLKAAQQQIENLSKRLHDTQSAFHRANEERSRLEKELSELRNKKDNDDDWFSDEDKERLNKISSELDANKKQMEQLEDIQAQNQQQAILAQWNLAAAQFSKEHPDFEEVVYQKFGALLDEEKGDPAIRSMWAAQTEKTPAEAYKFAKTVFAMQEMQNDPDAYKAKIRAEVEEEFKTKTGTAADDKVTGKDGLDLLNSADAAPAAETYSNNESAVDFVFR